MKIVITCRQMARDVEMFDDVFERLGFEVRCPPVVQELAGDELVGALAGATGVIAGDDQFTKDVLAQCPGLRVISKWGIGVDGIDRKAAVERGITVTNTPGAFGDEVADVVVGYLVLLARKLHVVDRSVRDGGWAKPVGTSLAGKSFGLVGLGDIGRAVAVRAMAMGMTVHGADPSKSAREEASLLGVEVRPLEETLAEADAVSLNCPLTPETFHLINDDRLARLKTGAYLINTSRRPVIDEPALVRALESGQLAGAALDVFKNEPLPMDSPLRTFEQVILGSHNASNTWEASIRTHWRALENLVEALGMQMP